MNEVKGSQVLYETRMLELTDETKGTPFEINEKKYSSHSRLMRVTAWCMRIINSTRTINIRKGTLTLNRSISEIVDNGYIKDLF